MNARPIDGTEVLWRDRPFIVVRSYAAGCSGWWVILRSEDDGHETGTLAWNLERISPPPIMEANVIAMPRRQFRVIEGGLAR